jgi:transcriptional regulator with XRE-family HTH domain
MKKKSLRTIAKELGVNASYLSQIMNGKRPASKKVLSKLEQQLSVGVKQSVKQIGGGKGYTYNKQIESGGSAWESNPPKTALLPPNGFEVREAHRDSSAPLNFDIYLILSSLILARRSPSLQLLSRFRRRLLFPPVNELR